MPQTKLDYQISIDKVVEQAQNLVLKAVFNRISSDRNGAFIVSNTSNSGVTGLDVSPYKEQTLYFDQYSGKS